MRKNLLLTLCFLVVSFVCFAGKFVLIPVNETRNLESLFNNKDLKIHYYCTNYVLATSDNLNFEGIVVLDEHAFSDVNSYAIVYCYNNQRDAYVANISNSAKTLYAENNFLIMKIVAEGFMPAKNDGIVVVENTEARLPKLVDYPEITKINPNIQLFCKQVKTKNLESDVLHLQNYKTRVYYKPQAYQAQNWLKGKFEALGLEVELQTVSTVGAWTKVDTSSSNVIAIQKGTVYPDKYIVCGCHYDSFVQGNHDNCPGADDNATGVATVLEMARILSQYEFEYSIVYCCFAAEEVGLYGSKTYANYCKEQEMDIIGYFNIDMSGYLKPGNEMMISLIAPSSATPLTNYTKNINDVYFQIPLVVRYDLEYGDSDHTSFNQNGFQGVWTFEDWENDSPFIHSTTDIIGPSYSVNNPTQMNMFTQVNIACIATLAGFISPAPPTNCVAISSETQIRITWEAPEETTPDGYYVYRDSVRIFEQPITANEFIDTFTRDLKEYCYNVTAVYNEFESNFSNESCAEISINSITEYSSNFKIYPNPAKDELSIVCNKLQVTSYKLQIEIFDVNGRQQKAESRKQKAESEIVLDISHLPAGVYFIKISDDVVGKFIKE